MSKIINRKYYVFSQRETTQLEKKYKAEYIGDFDYVISNLGDYSSEPAALFYVKNPDRTKNHSNYLAISRKIFPIAADLVINKGISLFNGEVCLKHPIPAIKDQEGNYHTSSFNHDYVKLDNGSRLDGGRGLDNRVSIGTMLHYVEIKDGELVLKTE